MKLELLRYFGLVLIAIWVPPLGFWVLPSELPDSIKAGCILTSILWYALWTFYFIGRWKDLSE